MQLDRMEAVIRPRSAWEAADLGMLMAVRWWWPMTKAWLVITVPAFALLMLLPVPGWAPAILFWWLKPVWERIHLYIVSRALFGHVPGVRETCRAFPKLVWPRLFASLLWGRFNAYRSMDAPVMQLEGLRGTRYRQRVILMHAEDDKPARSLFVAGAVMESLLLFASSVLLGLLIPEELDSVFTQAMFSMSEEFFQGVQNVAFYACMTLVAPFYVAAGFALYLNRRVKLEAWDIEIDFRKMAAAHAREKSAAFARVALLVIAFALPLAGHDSTAQAAEAQQSAEPGRAVAIAPAAPGVPSRGEIGESVREIMAREEFHEVETRSTPEMDPELAETLGRWLEELFRYFRNDDPPNPASLFAVVVELLLWIVLLGLIGVVLWHYRDWLRGALLGRVAPSSYVATSHNPLASSIDPRDQSLPADVAAACKELYRKGAVLEAVALLYRASLVVFTRAHRFTFADSSTEGEHLATVRATLAPATATYFMTLSRLWLFMAYGKRAPGEHALFALADSWQRDWHDAVQEQAATQAAGLPAGAAA
jgi:hypothetical protein